MDLHVNTLLEIEHFECSKHSSIEDNAERIRTLHHLLGEQACRQLGIYPLPSGFKLSVVIPVYNEERWIREVIQRVRCGADPEGNNRR